MLAHGHLSQGVAHRAMGKRKQGWTEETVGDQGQQALSKDGGWREQLQGGGQGIENRAGQTNHQVHGHGTWASASLWVGTWGSETAPTLKDLSVFFLRR